MCINNWSVLAECEDECMLLPCKQHYSNHWTEDTTFSPLEASIKIQFSIIYYTSPVMLIITSTIKISVVLITIECNTQDSIICTLNLSDSLI